MDEIVKKTIRFLVAFAVIVLAGCKSDAPKPSEKEKLQDALVSANWLIDVTDSDISGITGSPDINTTMINFTATEAGATFSLGGDITAYVTGGSFNIADNAISSNLAIEVDEAIVVTGATLEKANTTAFKISFTTAVASGRIAGIGAYTLSFKPN